MIIIIVAGLWPFNFFAKNKVAWLQNRNGVHFHGQGQIVSAGPIGDKNAFNPEQAVSLEIRLRPLTDITNGVPGIVTFYDGSSPDYIQIGQWKSHLEIWSRADNPMKRKKGKLFQEIGLRDALIKDRDILITLTSGKAGTNIYLDGNLTRSYPKRQLIVAEAKNPIGLILGNSSSGQSYWNGYLFGLAIYSRTLAQKEVLRNCLAWQKDDLSALKALEGLAHLYALSERKGSNISDLASPGQQLIIPHYFKPVRRIILMSLPEDFHLNWSTISDIGLNVLGFIPVGFFFALYLKKRTHLNNCTIYILIVLTGFGLSLFIELTQAFLPTRCSEISDVICNTLGTILGVACIKLRVTGDK